MVVTGHGMKDGKGQSRRRLLILTTMWAAQQLQHTYTVSAATVRLLRLLPVFENTDALMVHLFLRANMFSEKNTNGPVCQLLLGDVIYGIQSWPCAGG